MKDKARSCQNFNLGCKDRQNATNPTKHFAQCANDPAILPPYVN